MTWIDRKSNKNDFFQLVGKRPSILRFTKSSNWGKIIKTRKWSYLAQIRSKLTFFDSIIINSKSWRKQSIFLFLFRVKLSELGPFLKFWRFLANKKMLETKKWPYLLHFDSKCKNKGTLFPQALKSEGNKVPLFLHFELKWKRYGQFLVWSIL